MRIKIQSSAMVGKQTVTSLSAMTLTVWSLLLCFLFLGLGAQADTQRRIQRQRVGAFNYGKCVLEGRYTHDLASFNVLENKEFYNPGETWQERCRNCSCNVFGASCDGPVCLTPYDFSQEEWCIRWSSDGCCCEEMGCTIDEVQYPLGEQFPYGQGNPCLLCTCEIGTNREHCLHQNCGDYSAICDTGEMTVDEDCCPHYTCPEVPCSEIPDPNPDTSRHELYDWYGAIADIPVGMTRHFHVGTWSSYVCECEHGPVATCEMVHH